MCLRNAHWWTQDCETSWQRAKVALVRDWEQTKQDLGLESGEELNQDASNTVLQAAGRDQ